MWVLGLGGPVAAIQLEAKQVPWDLLGKLWWSSSGGHGEYFSGYIDYIILKGEAS